MRSLSVIQPWASLVALGEKTLETRSWPTRFRGDIAIHASKSFPGKHRALMLKSPFYWRLRAHGYQVVDRRLELPRGAVIAVVTLLDCFPTTDGRIIEWLNDGRLRPDEIQFGDYTRGRWAWQLSDIRPLREPIPCKGALGLWPIPSEVVRLIKKELR